MDKPCEWCTETSHKIDSHEAHIEKLEGDLKSVDWIRELIHARSLKRLQAIVSLRSENLRLCQLLVEANEKLDAKS